MLLAKAALMVWLVPSVLAPSQVSGQSWAQNLHLAHRIAGTSAAISSPDSIQNADSRAATSSSSQKKSPRPHRAAARSIERKLLLITARSPLLTRFVDRSTGLVDRNVAARCARMWGRDHRRLPRFLCRVWAQPRRPASGVAVVCHTQHRQFRVTAYHPHRRKA